MDGDSLLSEPWTSVTRFALLNENQKEGNIGIRGRLTKKEVTAKLGQILGRLVKDVKRFTAQKWECQMPDDDPDYEEIANNARRT